MVHHNLFTDFIVEGKWWLPSTSINSRVSGSLYFDSDQATILKLDGAFVGFDSSESFPDFEIILGLLHDGTPCTLLKNQVVTKRMGAAGHVGIDIQVWVAAIGEHYERRDQICLSELRLHFTQLEIWFSKNPFVIRQAPIVQAEYHAPEQISFNLRSGETFRIETFAAVNLTFNKVVLENHTYIAIVPTAKEPLDELLKRILPIRQLLSILTDRRVDLKNVEGVDESSKHMVINLYAADSTKKSCSLDVVAHNMLFLFSDLSDIFPDILNKWIERGQEVEIIYELFFAGVFYDDLLPRFNFLSLMQAIESFHRVTIGGEFLKEEEYRKIRKEVVKAIPGDLPQGLGDSIRDSLLFANRLTLKQRLYGILNTFEDETKRLLAPDQAEFVKRYAGTRDFLTHNDKKKGIAFKPEEFSSAAAKLRIILRLLLLRNVGIPESRIRAAVLKNAELNNAATWTPVPVLGMVDEVEG